jgi:hypothetical protein
LGINMAGPQKHDPVNWLSNQDGDTAKITIVRKYDALILERFGQYQAVRSPAQAQREDILDIAAALAKKMDNLRMNVLVSQQFASQQVQRLISAVMIVSLLSDCAANRSASSTSSGVN